MSTFRRVCAHTRPKARTLVLLGVLMALTITGDIPDHCTLRSPDGTSFTLPFETLVKHCRAVRFRVAHDNQVGGPTGTVRHPEPEPYDVSFSSDDLATLVNFMQNTVVFGIATPDYSCTEDVWDCTGAIRRECRAMGRRRAVLQPSFLDPDPEDLGSCSRTEDVFAHCCNWTICSAANDWATRA